MHADQAGSTVNQPPSARPPGGDCDLSRADGSRGRDPLEVSDDRRSVPPPGVDSPNCREANPRACDAGARAAGRSRASPDLSEPAPRAVPVPDGPDTARCSAGQSLRDPPDHTAEPWGLLDRRHPRRGWEQKYGVPSYLSEAADVLYRHRRRAADPDLDVIDAAILRLFWPWMRRGAASIPIPQEAEG
jgi:hypothetical protein